MEDNDKDDNNFKDISDLGLNRDLEFSRGHQTKSRLAGVKEVFYLPTVETGVMGIKCFRLGDSCYISCRSDDHSSKTWRFC